MSSVNNAQRRLLNSNDEIELFEFFRLLWSKKWFISLITCIGIIIGITIIKSSPPVYEAKAIISPLTLSEVENINAGRTINKYTLIKPFDRLDIYNIFKEHLDSGATKQALLAYLSQSSSVKDKNKELSKSSVNNHFLPIVSAGALMGDPLGKQFVSVRYTDVKRAAELAMKYVEIANHNAVNELFNTIKTQNDIVVSELQSRVNAAITAREQIDSQKSQLSEAQNNKLDKAKKNNSNTTITNKLKSDLSSFNSDFSQLIYDSRLREMQENLELYKNFKIDKAAFLYHLDGGIQAPITPVSPRKNFILFLSTVLGLIIGMSFVFLKALITERKIIA